MDWEPAEKVQKNDAGEYRAMIDGQWIPVARAQKNDQGEYRIVRFDKFSTAEQEQSYRQMTHPLPQKDKTPLKGVGKSFMQGLTTMPLGVAEFTEAANEKLPYYLQSELPKLVESATGQKPSEIIRNSRDYWELLPEEQSVLSDVSGVVGTGLSYAPVLPTNAPATLLGKTVFGSGASAVGGAISPTEGAQGMTPDELIEAKLKQAGFGGLVGFGLPLGIGTGMYAGRGIKNVANKLTQKGGERVARSTLKELAGDQLPAIRTKLANDYRPLTAAQIASEIPNVPPQFVAMDYIAKQTSPAKYQATVDAQKNTALDQLERLSGGRNKEQTLATVKLLEEARNNAALPIKDRALRDALNTNELTRLKNRGEVEAARLERAATDSVNDVRRFATAKQKAELNAANFNHQIPITNLTSAEKLLKGQTSGQLVGNPRVPGINSYGQELANRADDAMDVSANQSLLYGNQARNITAQTQALGNMLQGVKPIHKDRLIASIDRRLADPAVYGAKEARDMLSAMRDEIETLAANSGKDGLIDPIALNAFRVHGPRAAINKVTSGQADPTATKKFLMGENINIKNTVDDVIRDAGGVEWDDYLKEYSRLSHLINEVKQGGDLSEMYRNSPKEFIKAITGDRPEVFQEFFQNNEGFGNITQGTGNYRQLSEGLERNARRDELVDIGIPFLSGTISEQAKNKLKLELLHRTATITNKVTDILHGRANEREIKIMADLFATPEGKKQLARLLGETKFEQLGRKLSSYANQAFYPGLLGLSTMHADGSENIPVGMGPIMMGVAGAGLLGGAMRDWWKNDNNTKEVQY